MNLGLSKILEHLYYADFIVQTCDSNKFLPDLSKTNPKIYQKPKHKNFKLQTNKF